MLSHGVSERGRMMLLALADSAAKAGVSAQISPVYSGTAEWLVLYGVGAPERRDIARNHVARGGRVIAWDLGYWGRERSSLHTRQRVTIDAPHPQALVMKRDWPADRYEQLVVPRETLFDPAGHILIAGMGPKSCVQYGWEPLTWPMTAMAIARRRWPLRRVVYRPKKPTDPLPEGIEISMAPAIREALRGASLVLVHHSNVAVDALCAGIPALARDGAAAAICGRPEDGAAVLPEPAVLERFLRNLAWFQWSPVEAAAGDVWPFLRDLLER